MSWNSDLEVKSIDLSAQGRSITKRMSKKDANAFLKAVKRFGRIERMADIAQEVGPALQDQPATARWTPPNPPFLLGSSHTLLHL